MKLREVVWGVGTHSYGNYECGGLQWGEVEERESRCAPKEGRRCFWEFIDTLQLELPGNGSPAESYFSQGQAHFRSNSHPVTALCRPNMGNSERSS